MSALLNQIFHKDSLTSQCYFSLSVGQIVLLFFVWVFRTVLSQEVYKLSINSVLHCNWIHSLPAVMMKETFRSLSTQVWSFLIFRLPKTKKIFSEVYSDSTMVCTSLSRFIYTDINSSSHGRPTKSWIYMWPQFKRGCLSLLTQIEGENIDSRFTTDGDSCWVLKVQIFLCQR